MFRCLLEQFLAVATLSSRLLTFVFNIGFPPRYSHKNTAGIETYMKLFGVKAEIKVNDQKSKFNKIRPIIEEWLKVNRDFIEQFDGNDNLYWYNERSTISSLAGAVWRCGGFAQEEYSSEKGGESNKRMGRVDLFFRFNSLDVVCEAKQLWIYLPEKNKKDMGERLTKSLDNAVKDVEDTIASVDYHDFGLAIAFVVPHSNPNNDVQETRKDFLKALQSLDCTFYATLEFSGKPMIGDSEHEYNSVCLIGKIIK